MQLPIRILDAPLDEPVIRVDGTWAQRGLNLSHWPGNQTPAELRHDLSTGSALRFARLPQRRREELARGCVAIANNHYDTDGVCALFAVRHPEAALAREAQLLAAAEAGDLFRFPSERAFALDAIVSGLDDPERSPWRADFAGLGERARHEHVANEVIRILPELLDGALEPFAELWRPELERCLADRRDLATAARDEIVHLDLAIWTAATGARGFDPGRHALFGDGAVDRALAIGPGAQGTSYRFVINTTSWFDLCTRRTQPRPDLAALAARLNELEGTREADAHAWRAQPKDTPAPELWFGREQADWFAEHSAELAPSPLEPTRVRAEVLDALRAAWVFPEDAPSTAAGPAV